MELRKKKSEETRVHDMRSAGSQFIWKQEKTEGVEIETGKPEPGVVRGSRQGKRWLYIGSAVTLLLAALFFTVHFWTDAGCGETAVCRLCGKERPGTAAHQWTAATCVSPKICLKCGETEGIVAEHQWNPATCTTPQSCRNCGQVTGSPLAHQWQEGTCEMPRYCVTCGVTDGEGYGHIWQPATFVNPQTCTLCGQTEGTPIDWRSISMKDEIEYIRDVYYDFQDDLAKNRVQKEQPVRGIDVYYDLNGNLKSIVIQAGTAGRGEIDDAYRRAYYYDNNQLIFAFFSSDDRQRLYFRDELLIRWIHTPAGDADPITREFEFTHAYLEWERLAVEEAVWVRDQYANP